jgi:hypothetical protein
MEKQETWRNRRQGDAGNRGKEVEKQETRRYKVDRGIQQTGICR